MTSRYTHSKFLLPSTFSRVVIRKFPEKIYGNSNLVIELHKFSKREKLDFFELDDYKIQGSSCQYSRASSVLTTRHLPDYLRGYYQFSISITPQKTIREDQEVLNDIKDALNFALHVIGNNGLLFWKWESSKDIDPPCGLLSHDLKIDAGSTVFLSEEKLSILKKLLPKVLPPSVLRTRMRKDYKDVRSLFFTTLTTPNIDLKGAMLVVLLERLFLSGEKSENRNKFSLRIAKSFQKDLNFFKEVKKMYDVRSSIFHGGHSRFSKENVAFLLDLAQKSLVEYIMTPDKFKKDAMNELLLKA